MLYLLGLLRFIIWIFIFNCFLCNGKQNLYNVLGGRKKSNNQYIAMIVQERSNVMPLRPCAAQCPITVGTESEE